MPSDLAYLQPTDVIHGSDDDNTDICWYVLRDLKRSNAKVPAYKMLADLHFEVFTPMHWVDVTVHGKRKRVQMPALSDLLFVRSSRELLNPVISKVSTLQYRFVRGAYCKPLVVRDVDMEAFIRATSVCPDSKMIDLSEVVNLSVGDNVRIIGGALDGITGKILHVKGARKKRILVSIPDLIAAVVEVDPQFISKMI